MTILRTNTTMRFDVVIAGGGVVGSACAYFLAQNQAFNGSVAVIEPDPSYQHAASTLSVSSIRQQFSVPINVAISQFGIDFLRCVPGLLASGDNIPEIGLTDSTYLYLSTKAGIELLHNNVEMQQDLGVSVNTCGPDDLRRRFPWLRVDDILAGSMTEDGEGWFDGYQFLMALRNKARTLGVHYIESRVEDITLSPNNQVSGITLTGQSQIACSHLVNASGTHSRWLCARAGIDIPVQARKRCVFVFDCEGDVPNCPLVIDPSGLWFRPEGKRFICSLPPEPDQNVDLDDFTVDHALFENRIWPILAHRVAAFEAIKVGSSWAGHYDYNTFDQNAIVGPHPRISNLYLASGFSGHGLQQAPAIGRGLSEHIIHGEYRTLDLLPLAFDRLIKHEPLIEHNVI